MLTSFLEDWTMFVLSLVYWLDLISVTAWTNLGCEAYWEKFRQFKGVRLIPGEFFIE